MPLLNAHNRLGPSLALVLALNFTLVAGAHAATPLSAETPKKPLRLLPEPQSETQRPSSPKASSTKPPQAPLQGAKTRAFPSASKTSNVQSIVKLQALEELMDKAEAQLELPPGSRPGEKNGPSLRVPVYSRDSASLSGFLVLKAQHEIQASGKTVEGCLENENLSFYNDFNAQTCSSDLVLERGSRYFYVEQAEYGYERKGVLSYRASLPTEQGAWSEIRTGAGVFWIHTEISEVVDFESLVSVVEQPEVVCTGPGVDCKKTSAGILSEMERIAPQVSCFASPYEVTGVIEVAQAKIDEIADENADENTAEKAVFANDRMYRPEIADSGQQAAGRIGQGRVNRRFYRLELLKDNLPAWEATFLPQTLYVPTRKANGEHTGTFFSRGC